MNSVTHKTQNLPRACPHCQATSRYAIPHPNLGYVCPVCLGRIAPKKHHRPPGGVAKRRIRQLAEREGWVCHLCDEPIDPDATGPLRATLDHLIPKSAGGGWQLSNLKLAHSQCNQDRGAKPLAEC